MGKGSNDIGKAGLAFATGGLSIVGEELIQKPQRQAEQLMKDQKQAQADLKKQGEDQAAIERATKDRDRMKGAQNSLAGAMSGRASTAFASGARVLGS